MRFVCSLFYVCSILAIVSILIIRHSINWEIQRATNAANNVLSNAVESVVGT